MAIDFPRQLVIAANVLHPTSPIKHHHRRACRCSAMCLQGSLSCLDDHQLLFGDLHLDQRAAGAQVRCVQHRQLLLQLIMMRSQLHQCGDMLGVGAGWRGACMYACVRARHAGVCVQACFKVLLKLPKIELSLVLWSVAACWQTC